MIKIGDRISTWFSYNKEGLSTVIDIRPYDGRFKDYFNCILKLTAPRTRKGWLEMSYKDE